ncbi:MAG: histidine--tRNA ligase [Bacteroidetes bacterium]|nr:histidine--tRNA ligase [Bacteroidota bacterium]
MIKPSIPSGTRDFGTTDMLKRNYIFNTIKQNFELFGYSPIETPAMEKITTLTGKYGDEGDQLIFKILNSRIHESKQKDILLNEFKASLEFSKNSEELTEKALRYDLTVPFARYVVMNQHNLTFPFKRYQIQPVWRADRPQKGRYREFFQCDADVIGSDSLINELELINLMDKCFAELKIPVTLKFNNRKILSAIAQLINEPNKIVEITVAIDKLDKIGVDGVNKELQNSGVNPKAIEQLQPLINFKGNNLEKVSVLAQMLNNIEIGLKGIEEINFILNYFSEKNLKHILLELDITLARGLTYYTGTIFEAKANAGNLTSSILGGGRYDDLTGIFGLKNMSGVGISFGIDRIFDVMNELNVYPNSVNQISTTQLMFAHFGNDELTYCLNLANELRQQNINCEVYPDLAKIKKQFDFANKKQIPYVCVIGSEEMQSQLYTLKNLASGEQEKLSLNQIIQKLK